jgi:hypothetical protein
MSLPGHITSPTQGELCVYHPETHAIKIVKSETASFGAKYTPMCEACYADYKRGWSLAAAGRYLDDEDDYSEDPYFADVPPVNWVVRYYQTDQVVRNRHGMKTVFASRRAANNFVRRHRGKLRGKRIVVSFTS